MCPLYNLVMINTIKLHAFQLTQDNINVLFCVIVKKSHSRCAMFVTQTQCVVPEGTCCCLGWVVSNELYTLNTYSNDYHSCNTGFFHKVFLSTYRDPYHSHQSQRSMCDCPHDSNRTPWHETCLKYHSRTSHDVLFRDVKLHERPVLRLRVLTGYCLSPHQNETRCSQRNRYMPWHLFVIKELSALLVLFWRVVFERTC